MYYPNVDDIYLGEDGTYYECVCWKKEDWISFEVYLLPAGHPKYD